MVEAPLTTELSELEARPARHARPALGYAMVLTAMSLFGASGVLAKVTIESGLSTFRLAEARCAGGAILFLAAAFAVRPRAMRVSARELAWLVVLGILGLAFVQFLYFVAISRLDVGVALVIQYVAPVLVALWARLVMKAPVRRQLWYGLALAMVGLTLVVDLYGGVHLDGLGAGAALLSAVTYAAYILMAERTLARGRDTLTLLAWGFAIATVFWSFLRPWWSFPWARVDDVVPLLGRLEGVDAPVWVMLVAIVVGGTFTPFLLLIGSLHHLPATRVTIAAMIEPVVASAVAYAWLREALSAAEIAGGLLVLAGVLVSARARAV